MTPEDQFSELRGLAFGVAYRMLGTATEADDAVQDAFVRLQRAAAGTVEVRDPEAYLVTVTTRVAIDRLRASQATRESYVGTWLPEPVLTDGDPVEPAIRAESLSMAVLLLLERLTPVERAVFVLREAFAYGYDEIAEVVDKSAENCRQIFVRANRRVASGRPRFETSLEARRRLVGELVAACRRGDLEGLEGLLAEDVALHGDGGGKVRAFPRPVLGQARTARLLLSLFQGAVERGCTVEVASVNHQPGLVVTDPNGSPVSVAVFDVDQRVRTIHTVVNPDKLTGLGRPCPAAS